MRLAVLLLSAAFATVAAATPPDPLVEIRYCGVPKRDPHGRIVRSHAVLKAFQITHPCPSSGSINVDSACPGWAMDHVWPLAKGGCDAVWNLQWLPNSIKSCADPHCKDRFERLIYGDPFKIVP